MDVVKLCEIYGTALFSIFVYTVYIAISAVEADLYWYVTIGKALFPFCYPYPYSLFIKSYLSIYDDMYSI